MWQTNISALHAADLCHLLYIYRTSPIQIKLIFFFSFLFFNFLFRNSKADQIELRHDPIKTTRCVFYVQLAGKYFTLTCTVSHKTLHTYVHT